MKKFLPTLCLITSTFTLFGCQKSKKEKEPGITSPVVEPTTYEFSSLTQEEKRFYLNTTSGMGEAPEYNIKVDWLFKASKGDESVPALDELRKNTSEMNLIGEDEYMCFYISQKAKELYDDIRSGGMILPPIDVVSEYTPLLEFGQVYDYLIENDLIDVEDKPIQYVKISVEEANIPIITDDYSFLDMVRIYHDDNFNTSFVDTVKYTKDDEHITNIESVETYKFLQRNGSYSKMCWIGNVKYLNIQIEKENNIEIVKEAFTYYSDYIEKDSHYYDEIDACMIRKESERVFEKETYYYVTFDYSKIKALFGLQ